MANIDTTTRQKWPPPSPPPPAEQTAAQVEQAQQEAEQDPLRAKARAVLALLIAEYGDASWPFLDPVGTLVEIILGHRTTDPVAWAAFERLHERFPDWKGLLDAPVEEIEELIHGVTWPEQKAPRVKKIMAEIAAETGKIDLDFLKTIDLEEAKKWLTDLEGVGPKSAACVLLFSCRRPVLPVDTHLHRVSQRLGLIGPKVNAEKAHPILQDLLPNPGDEHEVLNFHRSMLLHGQRICVFSDPKCQRCALRDWCDYYATHPEKHVNKASTGKRK